MAIYLNPENTDLYRDGENGIEFVSSDESNVDLFPIRNGNDEFGGYTASEFTIPNVNANPLDVVEGFEGVRVLLIINVFG